MNSSALSKVRRSSSARLGGSGTPAEVRAPEVASHEEALVRPPVQPGVFLAEIIRDVKPVEVGLATAGSMMFAYLGTIVGPSLFGGLASVAGFPKAYLVMGAAVLLGGIVGVFGRTQLTFGRRHLQAASKRPFASER